MKKVFYLLMIMGLVISAGCDPMEDIHAEADLEGIVIIGSADYTLTDEDYDELGLTYGNFSSVDDVKSMIPPFLSEMYPVWGKGSSVLLGYDLYVGNAPGVSDYTYADHYQLSEDDYAASGSDVEGFYPGVDPSDYLADAVENGYASPAEGEHVLVKFRQYIDIPVKTVTSNYIVSENFDYGSTAGDLTAITTNWDAHSGAGSLFVGYDTAGLSMAGYPSSGTGGSMTITPSNREDVNLQFDAVTSGTVYLSALINLSTVGEGTYFYHLKDADFNYRARIGAKDDGNGKILFGIGASSSSLTYGTTPYDLNTTYLVVGSYNIDTGESNLHVLTSPVASEPASPEASNTGNSGTPISSLAIRQDGDGREGPTAVLDGMRVALSWEDIMVDDVAIAVDGEYFRQEVFYTYSGGDWEESEGVYFMQDADFDSMGEDSGQPGRYNNFGSSTPPDDYLPTFLGIKFPYGMEEDKLFVIYDYFSSSSGAQIRGNLYTVIDGQWVGHKTVISTTLQFGHDGTKWVPDNTIRYTLTAADYTYIIDTYSSVDGFGGLTANMATYGNFNGFSWSEDQINEVIGAVLLHNFPGMEEGQKFVVTFSIYDGSTHDTTTSLILEGGVYVKY